MSKYWADRSPIEYRLPGNPPNRAAAPLSQAKALPRRPIRSIGKLRGVKSSHVAAMCLQPTHMA